MGGERWCVEGGDSTASPGLSGNSRNHKKREMKLMKEYLVRTKIPSQYFTFEKELSDLVLFIALIESLFLRQNS